MASIPHDNQLPSTNDTQLVLACQDSMSQPLVTFHPFPKFPPEIRDMVWKLALPGGRRILRLDVIVKCSPASGSVSKRYMRRRHPTSRCKRSCVPHLYFECQHNALLPTLQTCQESRRITLKHYPLRLRAHRTEQEIRIGPEDVVELGLAVLDKSVDVCRQMRDSKVTGITVPAILSKIHTLSFTRSSRNVRAFLEVFDLANRRGALCDILFIFPGIKNILLIEDYNDATTRGSYPFDFVEFSNRKDQVSTSEEDLLSRLWGFAQVLSHMVERRKPDGTVVRKLPDFKIMYQEQARLAEIDRRSKGIGNRRYSPF